MEITFEELVKLYDTNIDLNKVSTKLKKLVLFNTDHVSLEDIKKPKYEKYDDGESYTYSLNDDDDTQYIIFYNPSNYRTMTLEYNHHIYGRIPDSIIYGYNGEITDLS